MKYRRISNHQKANPRKSYQDSKSLGSWSRMLHKWWYRDVMDKIRFKKEKEVNI